MYVYIVTAYDSREIDPVKDIYNVFATWEDANDYCSILKDGNPYLVTAIETWLVSGTEPDQF